MSCTGGGVGLSTHWVPASRQSSSQTRPSLGLRRKGRGGLGSLLRLGLRHPLRLGDRLRGLPGTPTGPSTHWYPSTSKSCNPGPSLELPTSPGSCQMPAARLGCMFEGPFGPFQALESPCTQRRKAHRSHARHGCRSTKLLLDPDSGGIIPDTLQCLRLLGATQLCHAWMLWDRHRMHLSKPLKTYPLRLRLFNLQRPEGPNCIDARGDGPLLRRRAESPRATRSPLNSPSGRPNAPFPSITSPQPRLAGPQALWPPARHKQTPSLCGFRSRLRSSSERR